MNIDDYMDMLAYEAEQEVDSFEAEIDFLHKELDVYKKAFELACVSLEKMCDTTRHCDMVNCPIYDDCVNNDNWDEHFLQKARKENEY